MFLDKRVYRSPVTVCNLPWHTTQRVVRFFHGALRAQSELAVSEDVRDIRV